MTPREKFEQREKRYLSPYAVKSAETGGRVTKEELCDLRTEFQRDRDRIIHSKAFRRLKHKTQVFLSPEGDHYRTRLTHTLEVAQIARTVSRALDLNEDLTEAIALGHDLGHTPFGHAGERTLDHLCPEGFRHNEQSLRVVNVLERKGGLNLTQEVRDGILCHTGDKLPQTLEGKVVRFADKIAYINHDIDDAVRGGVMKAEDIPKQYSDILGKTHSERINSLISSIIRASEDKPDIIMEDEVFEAMMGLRRYMFENVYLNDYAKEEEKKSFNVLSSLFEMYIQNPGLIPQGVRDISCSEDNMIVVRDHIAGMTDRYALSLYEKYFIPRSWRG
ncbi:MAG: deoxyguanosinetriphosphate triphosphohydrolase [Clostridia bacterium]|nr:deoxyguanosinetriphosphate triphosphohydrolase [Clostridia bacterium]MBR6524125.1 deoxyguanosinetriphosphate triphosphohydrolase [Clostridia bacterium]